MVLTSLVLLQLVIKTITCGFLNYCAYTGRFSSLCAILGLSPYIPEMKELNYKKYLCLSCVAVKSQNLSKIVSY